MALPRGTLPATSWTASHDDVADVVIVGAGASGSVAALLLSKAGFHVVCLEQGDWVPDDRYASRRPTFELTAFGDWHHNANVRGYWEDYPVNASASDVGPVMFNAVGGGTIMWGAQWPRMLPSDFRTRTLDGVGDDWPLTYEDLVPWYEANDRDFAVSAMPGDPAYPLGHPAPYPAFPINAYGRRFAEGMNAMGWSWWPAPNAIARARVHGLQPCARLGTCEFGCQNGSKVQTDITHWPTALRNGATLVTRARVSAVTVDARGRADGVTFLDDAGVEHRVRAEVVILAANGIGTPRILQLSATSRFPEGLANSSGLVGRNLMLHPTCLAAAVYDEPLDSWSGPYGQSVHSYEFYETDTSRGFVRGAKWVAMPSGGPLHVSLLVADDDGVGPTGPALTDAVTSMLGRTLLVGIICEDLADPGNRVDLDPVLVDSSGLPAPRVTYALSENSRRMVDWHLQACATALEASGAHTVMRFPVMPDQPGHLMGTARMGTDPSTSVVDPWCRSHDIPNLLIVDGSVFVTSAGVNPTNTIAALARRAVSALIDRAAEQLT